MRLEILRTDINKVVLASMDFVDERAALGEYISALMLAGIIKMDHSGTTVAEIGPHKYRLANGWNLEVRRATGEKS